MIIHNYISMREENSLSYSSTRYIPYAYAVDSMHSIVKYLSQILRLLRHIIGSKYYCLNDNDVSSRFINFILSSSLEI